MRIKIFLRFIALSMFLLCLGFFYLQVIRGNNFFYLSEKNKLRIIPQESARGKILDRNGVTLVDSRISFNLLLDSKALREKEKLIVIISDILSISKERVRFAVDKAAGLGAYKPAVIFEDIPKDKAFSIEEKIFDLPGIIVDAKPVRHYIYGDVGSHIFGYLGEVNRYELEGLSFYGYRMRDLIGRAGLEKFYNSYLKGDDGGMQLEVDSLGRRMRLLGLKSPRSGRTIELTIDIRLQNFADKIFEGKKGALIVMNPRSGEILALVSSPEFDPNIFVDSGNDSAIKKILQDKDKPLLNRAVSAYYPPGSVFKVVTAATALESGKINEQTTFNCTGKYFLGKSEFDCWQEGGHGQENIYNALKDSCNVFFYNTARRISADDLSGCALRFGFGRPTGIDIPDEIPGIVPSRFWKVLTKNEFWYEGETLNYAIGQGGLTVTPIQILKMVAAVSTSGELVQPYIAKRIGGVNIEPLRAKNLNLKPKTLAIIKEGMKKVVQDPDGTGRRANVENLSIAGKTGTAQAGTGKTPHAWFAGFAPFDDPKIAIVILIEHGGKGGANPAEMAGMVLKEAKLEGFL